MGAPPVAESSDLSEWQRSADDAATPLARNMPSTATGDVIEADWGELPDIHGTPSDLANARPPPSEREVLAGSL